MKTAIQKMIDKWESELGSYIPNAPIYKAFIEEAKTFLEEEKQQIIDAYIQGFCHCEYEGVMDTEKYYISTFETNKETLK